MYKDSKYHHIPVLYNEVLDTLRIKPNGIYVDCTAGGGGHSSGILKQLSSSGFLICIDQDPQALIATKLKLESLENNDAQFVLVQDKFSNIKEILENLNLDKVDGVLADLGVSSHQIDTASRGFSFQKDGVLDMRMNPKDSMTAADFVNRASEEEISYVIKVYGEERYALRIARNIVRRRKTKPFATTFDLVDAIRQVMPAKSRREQHPAKRTFQAIRIYINKELAEIETLLSVLPDCLAEKGRIDIISFHSLEDRIVKHKFKKWEDPCTCPNDFPICVCGKEPLGKIINRKGIVASQEDIELNSRARSARLRVFEMN